MNGSAVMNGSAIMNGSDYEWYGCPLRPCSDGEGIIPVVPVVVSMGFVGVWVDCGCGVALVVGQCSF